MPAYCFWGYRILIGQYKLSKRSQKKRFGMAQNKALIQDLRPHVFEKNIKPVPHRFPLTSLIVYSPRRRSAAKTKRGESVRSNIVTKNGRMISFWTPYLYFHWRWNFRTWLTIMSKMKRMPRKGQQTTGSKVTCAYIIYVRWSAASDR